MKRVAVANWCRECICRMRGGLVHHIIKIPAALFLLLFPCSQFLVVETKRFVGSTINVILTRQTCGQRSSKAAESKRRALGNYFFERICHMFLLSKCRGDWDLGLCTTSGLAFGGSQRSGDFRGKPVFRRSKNRILPLRCGSPNASPEIVHRLRS